jgi:transcriptional regulator with XRE-family HTH domain
MVSLRTPHELLAELCQAVKKRRKQMQLSQVRLAELSGVSVSTLRKYEQTGQISLASFIKLLFVLELADDLLTLFYAEATPYTSMDNLLKTLP